jgi:hypothetical protein
MRLLKTLLIVFVILLAIPIFASGAFAQTKSSKNKIAYDEIRNTTLFYSFKIDGIPAGAKSITAWVPLPPNTNEQTLVDLTLDRYIPYALVSESKENNEFLKLNLDSLKIGTDSTITITVKMVLERKAYNALNSSTPRKDSTNPRLLIRYLWPDKLVPTKGAIAVEAQSVIGGLKNPADRARAIYENIARTVRYDKSGQGCCRGDANNVLKTKAGDCADISSLFVGEARAVSLPTRFIMGLLLPEGKTEGEISDYHCWAEFFLKNKGWIPADITQACKYPAKKDYFYGGLDANRIQFSVGRDIQIPDSHSEPANFIIFPYVEIDDKPYQNVTWKFSFKE